MSIAKRRGVLIAALVLLSGLAAAAATADEILDRMEAEADRLADGSMVATLSFETTYSYGSPSTYTLGMLSKPDYSLIYFIEPQLDAGTMYLFVDEETDAGKNTRFWIYLPGLGVVKELVTEEELSGGFAGSSLSLSDFSGEDARTDYDVSLVSEEDLAIGEDTRAAYVLELIAKDGVDSDTPRSLMWIDTESYVMLRMEAYNDLGHLDTMLEVVELADFEGMITYAEMRTTDVLEESATVIVVLERHRPEGKIADEVFLPEALTSFDPVEWGF